MRSLAAAAVILALLAGCGSAGTSPSSVVRASIVGYKGHAFVSVRGPVKIISLGEDGYDEITRGFLDKYQREETYGNDTLIQLSPEHVSSDRIG